MPQRRIRKIEYARPRRPPGRTSFSQIRLALAQQYPHSVFRRRMSPVGRTPGEETRGRNQPLGRIHVDGIIASGVKEKESMRRIRSTSKKESKPMAKPYFSERVRR